MNTDPENLLPVNPPLNSEAPLEEEEEEDIRSSSCGSIILHEQTGTYKRRGWSGNNSLDLIRGRQASRVASLRLFVCPVSSAGFVVLVLADRLSAVGRDDP